jgi:O-antigen ligase
MHHQPSAASMVAEGVGRIADAAGVLLLIWLGVRMYFGPDAPLQDSVLLIGILGVVASVGDRQTAKNPPAALLAYVAIGLLSAAVHRWPIIAASANPQWLSLFSTAIYLPVMAVFIYGAGHLLRSPIRLSWFAVLVVIATFILSVQIAFDRASSGFVYVRGGPSLVSVTQWGGIHGTSLALTLALPLAAIGLAIRRSPWRAVASAVLATGFLTIAYLNGSRGGLLAMALTMGSIVLFALFGAGIRKRAPRFVGVLGAALVIVLFGTVWLLRGYMEGGSDLSGRTYMWQAALGLIAEHPWLGVGPANYGNAVVSGGYAAQIPSYVIGLSNAHNLFLHTMAEVGIAGGVCLLLFLGFAVRGCWRAWTTGHVPMVSLGILFALAGFLAHSLTENFFDARVAVERTRLIVWMFLAAALALDRLSRSHSADDHIVG